MNSLSGTSDEPRSPVSVMEGNGFYNNNALIPAAGGQCSISFVSSAQEVSPALISADGKQTTEPQVETKADTSCNRILERFLFVE